MKKLFKDIMFYSVSFIGCIAFMLLMGRAYSNMEAYACIGNNVSMPLIVIDCGHGGEDGGASANGVMEKDINLKIGKKLKDMFRMSGFKVKMIRDDDVSIYDDSANTVRQKKVSDLKNRIKIINEDKNAVLISIHQNKFPESKYSGAQIFYSKNCPESLELAQTMRKSIVSLIQPENTREIKPADNSIFILKNSQIPSVIVECGFLSNPEEASKLNTEEYQKQMAFAIYCGFMEYKRKF